MLRRVILVAALTGGLIAPAVPAHAAPSVNVTIQSATLINNFQVQVVGEISCTFAANYNISVQVRQSGPGQTIQQGNGFTGGECSTNGPTSWVVTVNGGPFSQGKALVTADGGVCDFTGCGFDTDSRQIRLRRA